MSAASATRARSGLLGLATLSVLAIGYELYAERHWRSPVQLVPWVALVVLLLAIALAALAARPALVTVARVLAVLALLASAFGVYEHVAANAEAGSLDPAYAGSWETRSTPSRVFLAATKTVGATPPIAPGALGQSALLVLLATVGRRRSGSGRD